MTAVTEDVAKTKWCINTARPAGSSADTWDKPTPPDPPATTADTRCLASGCMAWRWYDNVVNGPITQGYCGLAGKP